MATDRSLAEMRRPWWSRQGAVNVLTVLGIALPLAFLVWAFVTGAGVVDDSDGLGGGTYETINGIVFQRQQYADAGQFVLVPESAEGSVQVSQRAGFTAVRLPDGSSLAGFETGTTRVIDARSFSFEYLYRPTPDSIPRFIELTVEASREPGGTSFSFPGGGNPTIHVSEERSRPEIIIYAINTETRSRHHVAVDADGHLWVALDPSRQPFESRRGAALGVGGPSLGPLADEPLRNTATVCHDGVCQVQFDTGLSELLAPADGSLGCPGIPRVFQSERYEFRFWTPSGPYAATQIDCEPTRVQAGDPIGSPGEYIATVSGTNADSLWLDDDHHLVPGDFTVTDVGCPCREVLFRDFDRE